jgi:hypothetical protein
MTCDECAFDHAESYSILYGSRYEDADLCASCRKDKIRERGVVDVTPRGG